MNNLESNPSLTLSVLHHRNAAKTYQGFPDCGFKAKSYSVRLLETALDVWDQGLSVPFLTEQNLNL